MPQAIHDRLGRPLADLRISVTDRCNLRCSYCMPEEAFGSGYRFLPRSELLSFEEIGTVAALFVRLGVRKIRLTGGEPLLRRDLHELVATLARTGCDDLALTTNGLLLEERVEALARAGLDRITVSLDALDQETYAACSGGRGSVDRVLRGLEAALEAGLPPAKINVVVRKGVNDDAIIPLVERFHGTGHELRFIEYMDVGNHNGWRLGEVLSGREIVSAIDARRPLKALPAVRRSDVASRWAFRDGGGEIGIIPSVTEPFCRDCSRARLSSDGHLFTCLFARRGVDLKSIVRSPDAEAQLEAAVRDAWGARVDRYSEMRAAGGGPDEKVEMSYIGG